MEGLGSRRRHPAGTSGREGGRRTCLVEGEMAIVVGLQLEVGLRAKPKERELGLATGLATARPSKRPQNGRNGPTHGPTWASIENNKKQNK